ncbi:MAG: metallophosphoesterase [Blastocatellia bacterium]|nr:metallophosphoesterase [Blastocatellia bacterium]
MTEVFGFIASNFFIAAGRLVFSALLVAVQLYVLRAFIRIIRSMELQKPKEKLLSITAIAFIFIVNVPLMVFVIEGVFNPREVSIYSPSPEYESLMRPFGYVFFVWTLGSLIFATAAPISMAAFAAVQFFRRKRSGAEREATIQVFDLSRRRFLQMALMAMASMPFAVSAYGAVAARSRKVVEKIIVPIKGLPSELDGLTIVQMSDVHSGMFMPESRMSEYVKIANSLRPDLVALTGDFVSTSNKQVAPFIKAISALEAKHGVFGCLGNHDIFSRSERALARGFAEYGFKLLRNENFCVDIDGARLNVIGVDFIGRRSEQSSLDDALRGISLEGTTVLLSHSPDTFDRAARLGIDLVLAGHTHGGQIALTIGDLILTPARMVTMFLAGLFRIGDSHLYVNRGLGTTGPPIRINAPPEITHITLKAE